MVTIAFKLTDVKLESSEAYLLKLGKNLSGISKLFNLFVKCGFKYSYFEKGCRKKSARDNPEK